MGTLSQDWLSHSLFTRLISLSTRLISRYSCPLISYEKHENGTADNHAMAHPYFFLFPSESCYSIQDWIRQAVHLLQMGKRRAFRMPVW